MKIIVTILGVAFVVLVAGVALGSNLDDEYSGEWNYACVAANNGRPTFSKFMRADSRDEAETKVWTWARRQTPPRQIDAVQCQCGGEAGCE